MGMVGNERPCRAGGAGLLQNSTMSIRAAVSILIVSEYLAPLTASEYDVMMGAWSIDYCFARHEARIPKVLGNRYL